MTSLGFCLSVFNDEKSSEILKRNDRKMALLLTSLALLPTLRLFALKPGRGRLRGAVRGPHSGHVLTAVLPVSCVACSTNATTEPGISEDQSLYFLSLFIGLRCNERETLSGSQHRVDWKCLGWLCGVISLKGQKAMSRSCVRVSAGKAIAVSLAGDPCSKLRGSICNSELEDLGPSMWQG